MDQKKVSKNMQAKIRKFFKSIETPEGFTRLEEINESFDTWGFPARLTIYDDGEVKIVFNVCLPYKKGEGLEVSGTTAYLYNGGWYSFDRRGIEDSFSMYEKPEDWHGQESAWNAGNKMIETQILRCWEKIEYLKKTVVMPVLGFHITPDRKSKLTERFKKGGSETFTPGGMGTGHILSGKKLRYCKLAPKELSDFFGYSPLYHSTFDAD